MAEKYVMTVRTVEGEVRVPAWVVDHPSFLKWLRSGAVPEEVRIGYIRDEVWIEPIPERAYAHNQIKTLVASVLMPLVTGNDLGVYFGDGMTFTNEEEGFTCIPDGIFGSRESIDAGRVRLTGGKRGHQDAELVGIPDLIVEVVSDSSVDKDTEWLMSKYWNAGIPEYWLIDGRSGPLRFALYRHGAKGYVAVRKSEGWARSVVLARSFRFAPGKKQMGHATYQLEVR
ncbi:MAG: hypothetical protein JWO38_4302 [Gemmataceae bacterium]|nr:hypothetical protein [Gemmataceae bacterium]